jgi:hypothetical protein
MLLPWKFFRSEFSYLVFILAVPDGFSPLDHAVPQFARERELVDGVDLTAECLVFLWVPGRAHAVASSRILASAA